jgi:pentatricopeptide repeat protein
MNAYTNNTHYLSAIYVLVDMHRHDIFVNIL